MMKTTPELAILHKTSLPHQRCAGLRPSIVQIVSLVFKKMLTTMFLLVCIPKIFTLFCLPISQETIGLRYFVNITFSLIDRKTFSRFLTKFEMTSHNDFELCVPFYSFLLLLAGVVPEGIPKGTRTPVGDTLPPIGENFVRGIQL
ncbi:hypothetical protein AVEN_214658-1 [Araneus ventricosus]|uniref:Uncharacterized protein n=1 Tax=Araneus ventricosus TaxID=182803 RepID=A0A4Y2NY19_ARAVE|nr:hypothetical protein AVEN_214658-1 [Araneus ventricosus]